MTDETPGEIADGADTIVSGYAFSRDGGNVRVLDLRNPRSACVPSGGGRMIETTMGDVELALVRSLYARNAEFMAAQRARMLRP